MAVHTQTQVSGTLAQFAYFPPTFYLHVYKWAYQWFTLQYEYMSSEWWCRQTAYVTYSTIHKMSSIHQTKNCQSHTLSKYLLLFMAYFTEVYKICLCDCVGMHFHHLFKHCLQLQGLIYCLASPFPLVGCRTLADNWFTPPTSLVLSLLSAATLSNIAANITAPQHVPGSCFARYTWLRFYSHVAEGMGDVQRSFKTN